jgi:hypothetical protein
MLSWKTETARVLREIALMKSTAIVAFLIPAAPQQAAKHKSKIKFQDGRTRIGRIHQIPQLY